ncbi:FAD-dependent oxidoreductase [Christensenellaceae bacterium OttesenSCG-928-K19]|nr:FAD-dependent oxidoreductase [Christensenellaceae bacterium OttesenSCG-928-K19]
MYDVVIIGGGVVGAAIARELSRFRLSIAVLEKEIDIAMGATKANSAIVHGGYAEAHAKLKGRVCYQGRRQFQKLNDELDFGFLPIGSLVLAFEEGQRQGLVELLENGKKNGLPDLELLDAAQVHALEPNVNDTVKYALYCRGAGVCSPFELAVALMENAIANGVSLFLQSEVSAIQKIEDTFQINTQSGAVYEARYVVNAAGLYAAQVAAMAGTGDFSIHPRSGEYILMREGTGKLAGQVLFQMPTKMGKGILVTPTVYGNLLLGPDALDEQSSDRNTHVQRLHSIFKTAKQTTDKLDASKFLRSFAGVRAVASTDDFIIGKSSVAGFINAAGIQSPGVTSSPAIAQLVRDNLSDSGLELADNPHFNPHRQAPYVAEEPVAPPLLKELVELAEGKDQRIVCRCMQVRESAIREALARGIPLQTVDAVKRRTLAGMGMCQGMFCRPRTASLLSHHYDRPIDSQPDYVREGLQRVEKKEFLDYMRNNG